ncbi:MAG: HD domain-containing protein [bacterium]
MTSHSANQPRAQIDRSIAEAVVELGQLALLFGRTNRATYYEDGVTLESDTDHTTMLAMIACAFAARFIPRLDIGKVAQFSLVHDLVEAYAGDTPTLRISEDQRKAKDAREAEALKKIDSQFAKSLPWIPSTIEEYESLETPEARYVKAIDKVMPKITHALNNSHLIKETGINLDELKENHIHQRESMLSSYAHDQPEVIELHKLLAELVYERF